MSSFDELLRDTVFIVKSDGRRLGPYKSAVSSKAITVMEPSLDIDDGDHLARRLPNGKEEAYLVLSADYSPGLHSIPASYTMQVQRTTALAAHNALSRSTTVNIHHSTGVQVGDLNTQHVQATFQELVQRIERSSATAHEKAEAKSRLAAFLEHPLVVSVLGGAAGGVLGGLGGV